MKSTYLQSFWERTEMEMTCLAGEAPAISRRWIFQAMAKHIDAAIKPPVMIIVCVCKSNSDE